MKKILIKPLFMTTLILSLSQNALAEDEKKTPDNTPRQSTMIILDGSNSMWGQLQGINKIVTARESLKTLLENAHGSINFGLLTYGNKKKGCNDFTLISKPENYNKKKMLRNIRKMNPRGRSPIADALKKAAASLPADNAHILLVSDGAESCGGDPCAVAKELRTSNPGLQIDVIGFRDEKEAQLECIAENGNGAFVVADNTERLKTLLDGVQAKASTVGNGNNSAANAGLPGSVEITLKSNHTGSPPSRANFSIYKTDGSNIANFTSRTQVKEYLDPGEYRVKAQWKGQSYTDSVTVQAGKTSTLKFDASQSGILKLSALSENKTAVKVNYSIYLTNGDFISRHVHQHGIEVRIPATEYRVKADLDGTIQEKNISIEPNKENKHIFQFE